METIELFVQGEGIPDIVLVRVPVAGTVGDILEAGRAHRRADAGDAGTFVIFLEDAEEALDPAATLEAAGIRHRGRVHIHRCRQVAVTVNYNGRQLARSFPPSATIRRVKRWVDSKEGFDLRGVDATEHLLQVCGSNIRPDEDTHIGALVHLPGCPLCLDLVAKQRVEG